MIGKINVKQLCTVSKEGRDSIYAAFDEMEKWGYLTKELVKGDNGQFIVYDYTVYECPLPVEENHLRKIRSLTGRKNHLRKIRL
jgi:hypothetical protein